MSLTQLMPTRLKQAISFVLAGLLCILLSIGWVLHLMGWLLTTVAWNANVHLPESPTRESLFTIDRKLWVLFELRKRRGATLCHGRLRRMWYRAFRKLRSIGTGCIPD